MKFIQIIITVLIQLLGNFLKGIFLIHYKLFPGQRFIIPKYSKPLFKRSATAAIPRKAWQTNYTNSVTLPVYFNHLWNRLMAPTFEHHYWVDEDRLAFIKENFPAEVFASFEKLQIGAAQADYWRVLVLLKYGGIYMDVDAALCCPPALFLSREQQELFIHRKNKPITNYFLAAKPDHPIFKQIAEQIKKNIDDNQLKSVYTMTGPTVVHDIVKDTTAKIRMLNLTCKQGVFVQKVLQYPDKLKNYWVQEEASKTIVR